MVEKLTEDFHMEVFHREDGKCSRRQLVFNGKAGQKRKTMIFFQKTDNKFRISNFKKGFDGASQSRQVPVLNKPVAGVFFG